MASQVPANDDGRIAGWLESASACGVMMYSASALSMIGRALQWLLKSAGQALGTQLMISATVIDNIAWMLSRGARAAGAVATGLRQLVSAIFQFLVRTVSAGVEITALFLRWTLDLLFATVSAMASLAVRGLAGR